MEELQDILTNPTTQESIKTAAVWHASSGLWVYTGDGLSASGKTKEAMLKVLLNGIRLILRNS